MNKATETIPVKAGHVKSRMPHPVLMMLLIMLVATALTYLLDSGEFQRKGHLVIPGTYQTLEKDRHLRNLLNTESDTAATGSAQAASLVTVMQSIPIGLTKSASMIFMVMFIGGMFGILRKSGALDAGIDSLVAATGANVYWLTPLLMLTIACGSTFMGLISEYLVIIPVLMLLAERLGLPLLFATALVTLAAKIGYLASVTNPLALVVAQPIVDVPLLSGMSMRVVVFVLYLSTAIAYLLRYVKKTGFTKPQISVEPRRLSAQHALILLMLGACIAGLIAGTSYLHWSYTQLSAYYITVAILIAVAAGMSGQIAAEAFIDGMKGMLLGSLLIGLAKSIEIILADSKVLDTVIQQLASMIQGRSPTFAAEGMIFIEMILDVMIPSTSGKAAISMPILGPIGHLAGISGQSVVLAFLFGNGLTNLITPTSGMLLAYLATGRVGYGTWLRFIFPLFCLLTIFSMIIMAIAIHIGY